jgi:hypothetical protein
MTHIVKNSTRVLALLATLTSAATASAQMRGGMGSRTPAMTGAMAGRLTTGQAFARLSNNAATLGALRAEQGFAPLWGAERRLRNFYSEMPYGGYGGGYGDPGYMSGGFGYPTAYPTDYGAWIQQANSGVIQDDIAQQQASQQRAFRSQDLELRRLQLKRANFDQRMYEKMNTPPPEAVREELRQQRLTRARNAPPLDEIASGESLNELLTNIARITQRQAITGPEVAIDPELLRHVNVTTTGDLRGSNVLFKPGSLAQWPAAFADEGWGADKKKLQTLFADLARAQANGRADVDKSTQARRLVDALKEKLFDSRFQLSYADYMNGVNFLGKLGDAVDILSKDSANSYLNGTYAAKGSTVAELVGHMVGEGLQFATASPGDEARYAKLYNLLVTYDLGLNRKADELIGQKTAR